MTDNLIIPQRGLRRTRRFVPPLLILPFVIYNLFAFTVLSDPQGWSGQMLAINMMSGGIWSMSPSDLILLLGLVCLFFEILKSTRTGTASILEHILSTLVFVLYLIEFLLVRSAASSVFFLLMLMSLLDVIAGFSVSITSAGRDITVD